MIGRVAHREVVAVVRDGRLRWAMATLALLFATAVAAGWIEREVTHRDRAAAAAAMRAQWVGQDVRHPHAAAHDGIYVFPRRGILSFLDPGVDGYVGQTVWLEAHRQNPALYRPAGDVTGASAFGPLTSALVLQLLVPLLAIVLAVRSFASERESGLVRAALAVGADPRGLFVGKALGVAAAIACAVAPGLLLAAGVALTRAADPSLGHELAHAGVMGAGYGVYLLTVIVLALAVSAVAPSARHALIVLLAGWAALGLIVPRVAGDVITAAWPVPSIIGFTRVVEAERAAAFSAHTAAADQRESVFRSLLARQGAARVEDVPAEAEALLLQADEEAGHRVFDRHWGLLWEQLERQDRAYARVALVSPPLAIRLVSMALASTDGHAHHDFLRAAERHRRVMMDVLHGHVTKRAITRDPSSGVWVKVPPFVHEASALRQTLGRHAWLLFALAAWLLGAVAAAAIAVRRLPLER